MSILRIENIETFAFHGCLATEKIVGQLYFTDVIFESDFSTAMKSDSLNDTIDYGKVFETVKKEMSIGSNLIEHVTFRIYSALKSEFSFCKKITVRVTKKNPPVNGGVGSAVFEYSGE